jgi:hypothetical protein
MPSSSSYASFDYNAYKKCNRSYFLRLADRSPAAQPDRVLARKPVNKKAVALATCMVMLPSTVWAAFLTYSGGFIILFLLASIGLVVTTRPMPDAANRR